MVNRQSKGSLQKNIFSYIFIILAFCLILIPFVNTFNDVLTNIVIKIDGYGIIQKYIIPWELRLVAVMLYPFNLNTAISGSYLAINTSGNPYLIEIAWNCIGWQSLLFFLITAYVGLQGDSYSVLSKFKALIVGFLGTFLVNLVRIAVVAMIAYYFGQKPAIVVHDYGSLFINIFWLFFFWWFAYMFILEERI